LPRTVLSDTCPTTHRYSSHVFGFLIKRTAHCQPACVQPRTIYRHARLELCIACHCCVQCTVCSAQCAVHSVQCTVCSALVQPTLFCHRRPERKQYNEPMKDYSKLTFVTSHRCRLEQIAARLLRSLWSEQRVACSSTHLHNINLPYVVAVFHCLKSQLAAELTNT
jgi:hypothetical protein